MEGNMNVSFKVSEGLVERILAACTMQVSLDKLKASKCPFFNPEAEGSNESEDESELDKVIADKRQAAAKKGKCPMGLDRMMSSVPDAVMKNLGIDPRVMRDVMGSIFAAPSTAEEKGAEEVKEEVKEEESKEETA